MRPQIVVWLVAVVIAFVAIGFAVPEALGAAVMTTILVAVLLPVFRNYSADPGFVTKVFLVALVLRLAFGFAIYGFDAFGFFGGDALTYDFKGKLIADYWYGLVPPESPELVRAMTTNGPGWGMHYLVGIIYSIFGHNFLAAQTFAAVFGAATSPLVFICSNKVYENSRVAKYAAIGIAVFPAFVIWSGQLLKDGLIVFLLVLAMTMVLKLQEKFSYPAIILLIFALFGIISLRFYIFYMVAVAVAGSFIIGTSNSIGSVIRRSIILVVIGVGLTYLGVIQTASVDLERFGDLEQVQRSRQDLAVSADSGFADDIDVSTTRGAISAIPIGLTYLMLAPFPWEVRNFRQAITMPEILVWWAMIPLMIWGIWYTIRYRLRTAFSILLFSGLLTLAYSIFQGNVGTAYRQRTQIQVFLFMFIAVGWVLFKERREDRKLTRGLK